jgi:hypothetical protein
MEHGIRRQFADDQPNVLWIEPPATDASHGKMTRSADLTRVGKKLFLAHRRRLLTCHRCTHRNGDTPKLGVQSEAR